jgi:glycosyltransferase involved in cell wall biosynthesis
MARLTVSVIIPVYNAERYLEETLRSVLAQTYAEIEIICVNDGSTDGSRAVIERFGGRIRIIDQVNSGQTAAQNRGARESTGQLLAFLDSDDIWYPHKLEEQVAAMEAAPETVMVTCNYDEIDPAGAQIRQGVAAEERRISRQSPGLLMQLVEIPVDLPSFMLVRREAFEKIGGMDPVLTVWDSDYDLCVRLRDVGPLQFLEKSGGAKRIHPASNTHSNKFLKARLHCSVHFGEKLYARYGQDRAKGPLARTILADRYSDLGWHEIRFGDWGEGMSWLNRARRTNPWKFRTYSRMVRALGLRGGAKESAVR